MLTPDTLTALLYLAGLVGLVVLLIGGWAIGKVVRRWRR